MSIPPHQNQLTEYSGDLLKLINAILESTELYLFERSLAQFYVYMAGYERCAVSNKIELTNANILREFNAFLIKVHQHKKNSPLGWYDFFQVNNLPEVKKFALFRKYFVSFLQSLKTNSENG